MENGRADPMWYRQENPTEGSRTVGELESCEVDPVGGGVQCAHEGEALNVPYLVYPIDQAKGPADLKRYWYDTAPRTARHGGEL